MLLETPLGLAEDRPGPRRLPAQHPPSVRLRGVRPRRAQAWHARLALLAPRRPSPGRRRHLPPLPPDLSRLPPPLRHRHLPAAGPRGGLRLHGDGVAQGSAYRPRPLPPRYHLPPAHQRIQALLHAADPPLARHSPAAARPARPRHRRLQPAPPSLVPAASQPQRPRRPGQQPGGVDQRLRLLPCQQEGPVHACQRGLSLHHRPRLRVRPGPGQVHVHPGEGGRRARLRSPPHHHLHAADSNHPPARPCPLPPSLRLEPPVPP